MSHYDKQFVQKIINDRAEARRDRDSRRALNPDALRSFIPFREWLYFAKGIADWRQLKPYRLWDCYNEYQLDCVKSNLEYENPNHYGLYNTLF